MSRRAAAAASSSSESEDEHEPLSPGHKQKLKGGRAATLASRLNPENKCKWRVLNAMFMPDDLEMWQKAVKAPRWDSDEIVDPFKAALDDAWAVEQAQLSRQAAEQKAELERAKAAQKRNRKRREATKPLRKFATAKKLAIVHEARLPKKPDPIALENPNSLEYKRRRKRKAAPQPEESPQPPAEEVVKQAAELGYSIASTHKEKRQSLGAVDPEALEEAEAALAALPPAAAALLAQKAAAGLLVAKPTPKKRKKAAVEEKKEEKKDGDDAAEQAEIAEYYKKKLKELNAKRAAAGRGKLNKVSRQMLRDAAALHYQDDEGERGFAGTVLQGKWDRWYFQDYARHPDAPAGEPQSDEENE